MANATISAPKDATTTISKPNSGNGKIRQKSIANRLARHGAVQLMVLHLQMLNEAVSILVNFNFIGKRSLNFFDNFRVQHQN